MQRSTIRQQKYFLEVKILGNQLEQFWTCKLERKLTITFNRSSIIPRLLNRSWECFCWGNSKGSCYSSMDGKCQEKEWGRLRSHSQRSFRNINICSDLFYLFVFQKCYFLMVVCNISISFNFLHMQHRKWWTIDWVCFPGSLSQNK